jgi:hypothetical protein
MLGSVGVGEGVKQGGVEQLIQKCGVGWGGVGWGGVVLKQGGVNQ